MEALGSTRGSIRIPQSQRGSNSPPASSVTGSAGPPGGPSGAPLPLGAAPEGHSPRFPKLDECAHFHYEHVDLGPLQVMLVNEQDLSLGSRLHSEDAENRSYTVQVSSQAKTWLLRRSYDNFRSMDRQLHRCIYDRKFSVLPELPPEDNIPAPLGDPSEAASRLLTDYLNRFSAIAGNLINCGPVLSWFELDNRGRRLLVPDGDTCPINTPAVAAAYSVKRYSAQAQDEISFEVGDMISVIDMPPPEESAWWRGKRGFEVGFFPSDCVAVIGDKVPRNLQLSAGAAAAAAVCSQNMMVVRQPSKPVLRKHGKLIAFFRSFILSRPSRRRLKQSGILKERVFGCDLGEHLLNSGHDIPMVLKCCSEFIETNGIVDGIYRLSGVTSNIQKLRNAFDEDRVPALYEDEAILQDIHSVASLLKMYFRELPNPLCTYQLYHQFVSAVQKKDGAPEERLLLMRETVQKLPPPHYRTLQYLMKHLARVAERGHQTGMTPRNVAIVWAPNLLRCKALEVGGVAALQGVGVQAVVTEFLICYADLIFCERLPTLSIPLSVQNSTPRRSRPKSLAISTPTKLLSLEEARTRALLAAAGKTDDEYIEVGGGPACLPAKYHTIIELPSSRKRSGSKRSPLGWKSFFSKAGRSSTSSTHSSRKTQAQQQPRKTSTPSEINFGADKAVTESDIAPGRRRLRPVKSAESLASGNNSSRNSTALSHGSESGGNGTLSILGGSGPNGATAGSAPNEHSPNVLTVPNKAGHNRSVSHDSYFEHLAESSSQLLHDEEEGFSSSLDLSEIQLNFDLEESEMRIFSEDETLISTFDSTSMVSQGSPHPSTGTAHNNHARDRHGRTAVGKRLPPHGAAHLAPPEDSLSGGCGSLDPSPKKQKMSVNATEEAEKYDIGEGTISGNDGQRKRSRLEKQLTNSAAELRFIDSQSPEQPHQMLVVQADVHKPLETPSPTVSSSGQYALLASTSPSPADAASDYESLNLVSSGLTTPGTPLLVYSPLREESRSSGSGIGSTPDYENVVSPAETGYEKLPSPSPAQSPSHSASPTLSQEIRTYENVAPIPKPRFQSITDETEATESQSASASASPSLSASTTALRQMESSGEEDTLEASRDDFSIDLNVSLDRIFPDMNVEAAMDVGNRQRTVSVGRMSDEEHSKGVYENVALVDDEYEDIELAHAAEATANDPAPQSPMSADEPLSESPPSANETPGDPNVIYQQVKYLRRSIHEVNALLEKDEDGNPLDDSPIPSIPTSVSLTVSASELSDNDIEYVDNTPDSPERSIIPFDQNGRDGNYCQPESAQGSEFPTETEHELQPEGATLPEPISPVTTPLPDEIPQETEHELQPEGATLPEPISPVTTPLPDEIPQETIPNQETKQSPTLDAIFIPSPVEPSATSISPPSERMEATPPIEPIVETDLSPPKSPEDEVELRVPRHGDVAEAPEGGKTENDRGDRTSVKELLSRFETTPMDADSQWSPGSPPQSGCRRSDPSSGGPVERRAKSDSGRNRSTALSSSLDEDRFLSAGAPPRTLLLRTQTEPDVTSDRTTSSENKGVTLLKTTCLSLAPEEEDPERRLRVEKYKAERRNFLRQQYRSESFRDEMDETLTRLKQKAAPKSVSEDQPVTTSRVTRTALSTTTSPPRRIRSVRSPMTEEVLIEKPAIVGTSSSKRPPHRASLPLVTTVQSADSASDSGNRRLSVGNKRSGVDESHRRRYTASEGEAPLRSPQKTLSATSPSYCIRDMAALFEAKENRRSGGAPPTNTAAPSANKQYLSSV